MSSSQRQFELVASLLGNPTLSQPPPSALQRLLLQTVTNPPSTQSLMLQSSPVALAALAAAVADPPTTRPACAVQMPQPPTMKSEREHFLLFTKVLFKYLDRLNKPGLKTRAKIIIAECTQRNRMGMPGYTPLMSAVERRLKQSLGEVHYAHAQMCYHNVLRKTAARSINPVQSLKSFPMQAL